MALITKIFSSVRDVATDYVVSLTKLDSELLPPSWISVTDELFA